MLELPESTAIARQINDHLTGKIISGIKILQTPHRFAFFTGSRTSLRNISRDRP